MDNQDPSTHSKISAIWPWEPVPPGGHDTSFSGDLKGLYTNTQSSQRRANTVNANMLSIVVGR